MGVQGLWQLLHPAGKPVSPSSLEGKVLAVDVSIWLHQTMKGMRDKDGNPLPNAHLQGLFSRVCKLLFYRIRPVFVFDGGVPALKKQTLAARRERKENVDKEKEQTTQKILQNLLRSHAVRGVTGDTTENIRVSSRPTTEPDMFQLAPLPEIDKGSTDPVENAAVWEPEDDGVDERNRFIQSYQNNFQNLEDVDLESEEFLALPAEIRHEILTEMKEQRRENMLARIAIMPEESEDFSDYQLKKLLKQSRLTGRIESLRKEMTHKVPGDITYALGDNYYGEVVEAKRVVSEDAAHYILIKGLTQRQQVAEAERCKARRLVNEKKESERQADRKKMESGPEDGKPVEESEQDNEKSTSNAGEKLSFIESEQQSDSKKLTPNMENSAHEHLVSDDEVKPSVKSDRNSKRRISSDDNETVEEDAIKLSRKERRGKALVTRSGLRYVAKKGKVKRLSELPLNDSGPDKLKSTSAQETEMLIKKKDCSTLESVTVEDDDNDVTVTKQFKFLDVPELITLKTEPTEKRNDDSELTVGESNHDERNPVQDSEQTAGSISDTYLQGKTRCPPFQPQEESHFTETRNRLLTEEEDLISAREAKMAALMKSLEKRTQALESSQAETESPISEEPAHEDIQANLRQQEEDLIKEKETKMAALLKAVEKRSLHLQSESDLISTQTETDMDQAEKRPIQQKQRKQVGFLEDVARLEQKALRRNTKQRQAKPPSSAPHSSSLNLLSVPALTADYLEDVEAMMEVNEEEEYSRTENNSNGAETQAEATLTQNPLNTANLNNSSECKKKKKNSSNISRENDKHDTSKTNEAGERDSVEERWLNPPSAKGTESTAWETNERRERERTSAPPPDRPPLIEDDDSEDEGFIEITVDPTKPPEDDLFPASIFTTEPTVDTHPSQAGTRDSNPQRAITGSMVSDREEDDDNDDDDGDDGGTDDDVHNMSEQENQPMQEDVSDADIEEERSGLRSRSSMTGTTAQEKQPMEEGFSDADKDEERSRSILTGRGDGDLDKVSLRSSSVEEKESEAVGEGEVPLNDDDDVNNFTKGVNCLSDLYNLQRDLSNERQTLTLERGRQARLGRSITEQVNLEAQELLQLFGVPFVVSPMEAEAQCAELELLGMTQGTITDDSDAWLFGSSHVYKNFFNQTKYVEFYSAEAVEQRFGLDRGKLINVALLCGSDYTPGISGVGPVRAMEVMAEFPGEGTEGLEDFREWWEETRDGALPRNQGKVKNKLRTLELHEGFPSRQVVEAYLHPAVDDSEEAFTWGLPDSDLLQQYANKKFGWGKQKCDDVLEPMMKELTKKTSQGRINRYFQPENFVRPKQQHSKRLQQALDKFRRNGKSESESESESGSESGSGSGSRSASESESGSDSEESKPASPSENIAKKVRSRGRGRGSAGQGRGCGSAGRGSADRGRGRGSADRGRGRGSADRGRGRGSADRGRGRGSADQGIDRGSAARGQGSAGQGSAGRGGNRGRGRGKSAPHTAEVRARGSVEGQVRGQRGRGGRGRGRGQQARGAKHPVPARHREIVLREVSLSETSSSGEEDDDKDEPKAKKTKSIPSQPSAAGFGKTTAAAATKPSSSSSSPAKQKPTRPAANRKSKPKISAPGRKKPTASSSSTAGCLTAENAQNKPAGKQLPATGAGDTAAFKEAMGGDLDPSTMTLDDLGSDFSD